MKEVSVRLTDCQKKTLSPKKVILMILIYWWCFPCDVTMQMSKLSPFQEEDRKALPESPGKSMLMKFVDCSGTDITEKVKEVNEKELEARLKEDFLIPPEEETDDSSDVKEQEPDVVELPEEPGAEEEADLEVLEISHPKVQEVLIVLDEEDDKVSLDCILEKVEPSPEKVESEKSKVSRQIVEGMEFGSAVEVLNPNEHEVYKTTGTVSKSFEEEFSKFTAQSKRDKATLAESEMDSDTGGKEPEGNFSADDENDEESGAENVLVTNSSAWSSLSIILEPQVCVCHHYHCHPQSPHHIITKRSQAHRR